MKKLYLRNNLLFLTFAFIVCFASGNSDAAKSLQEINHARLEQYYREISRQNLDTEKTETFVQKIQDKDYRVFNPMKPTPTRLFLADLSLPEEFGATNNLAKKPGSFFRAFGEVIFLQGRVVDSFGVPITDARVQIWQKNAAGKYHSLLDPRSEYIDKHFNMSGRSITDNLGNYSFITILPGGSPGRAPHINMNVSHPKFGKLQTEVYFEKHPFNKSDFQYMSYSKEDRKALTAKVKHTEILNTKSIKICTFDIVMKGIQQYRGY